MERYNSRKRDDSKSSLEDDVAIFSFLLLTSSLNATIDDSLEHLFDLIDGVAFRKLQTKISEREE